MSSGEDHVKEADLPDESGSSPGLTPVGSNLTDKEACVSCESLYGGPLGKQACVARGKAVRLRVKDPVQSKVSMSQACEQFKPNRGVPLSSSSSRCNQKKDGKGRSQVQVLLPARIQDGGARSACVQLLTWDRMIWTCLQTRLQ